MAGAIDIIRDWAAELQQWEQAALEQIVSGRTVTDDDYKNLLNLFLEEAGLSPKRQDGRPALAFPTRLVEASNAPASRLERMFNLQDVNALPSGQEVRFGSHLTLIYGGNSAGKTGYTRPLGCAAFARGDREVLSNARKQNMQSTPRADIEVSQNGLKTTVTWRKGSRCPELSGVYVFDGASVSAHLSQSNPLSFSPAGLSLLTRLAEVTDTVRGRLRMLIESKSKTHLFSPLFPGDSLVSREIAKMGGSTDIGAMEKLAKLSPEEEKNVEKLDSDISILKAQNLASRTARLKQERSDLQTLLDRVQETALVLGSSAEEEAITLMASLRGRRQEADRVGSDQFRFEPFTQVGTDVWREFVTAAKALADSEAQRGTAYPHKGDHCLLCRQSLSAEAIDLINRLWAFMSSDAPRSLKLAEQASSARANVLSRIELGYFGADSAAKRILQAEASDFAEEVEAFLRNCSTRRSELVTFLTGGAVPQFTPVKIPELSSLSEAISRRAKEIAELEKRDYKQQLGALSQALRELQHRQVLRDHWQEIKTWIEDQKWAAGAQKKVGSTHHITAKYNELFKALVTDQYRETFETTLQRLKQGLRVGIETKGQKGTTVRQIVLSADAFVQKFPVEKILSDGEKRTVALVDFLTEASLDARSTALVLDDPVSSMDLDSKWAVAELLAELAATRQVIVFTHDLLFLHALKACAKKLNIEVLSHWIRREQDQPGYVYLNNSPTCEGDYKSASKARECYTDAKTAPPAKQDALLQQGFGALRSSYEAFVIYDLFNGAVRRFEEQVHFDVLKDVRVDDDIVDQVVEKMATLSRYIDAHLHSDSFAAEKPTPDLLFKEIETFEALRKKHRERKKAAASTGPKPASVGTSTMASGKATEPASAPGQPSTRIN